MRLNAPRKAAAQETKEVAMIKTRVSGLPEEVADFANALEATGCVLERSGDYKNRGTAGMSAFISMPRFRVATARREP